MLSVGQLGNWLLFSLSKTAVTHNSWCVQVLFLETSFLTINKQLCWACKWILNKVKKFSLSSKLLSACDEIGLLKPMCRKFVKAHLGELIEELTTTDDVRTICVNMGACKVHLNAFIFRKCLCSVHYSLCRC
uniref:Saposin B-type domain-containing protein n=1 Tax=Amphilophus citrinellus TaxID=61819 RepID=A0A3Q0R1L4_AMPCI